LSDTALRVRQALAASATPDLRSLWRVLAEAGVLEELRPLVSDGGMSGSAVLDDVLAELDAQLPTGQMLAFCVHLALALPLLERQATASPLAQQVFQRVLTGRCLVAVAATDAEISGSTLASAVTGLTTTESELRLVGSKDWITNASQCDYLLVLSRHRPAVHFSSFRWVLLSAGSAEQLVGRSGRGLAELARQMQTERLVGAIWAHALCRRVLADTHRFLVRRRAGAGPLWDNQVIRQRFARCLVELRRLQALRRLEPTQPPGTSGMVLKVACADAVQLIIAECCDLRGADAYHDNGTALLRSQSTMFGVAGGATGALLAGIAENADELLVAR
jgi:acyl-CoA dehydrogenase